MMNTKKGSTIIEVLVASTLIATAILAAISLSTNTQKQTDFSKSLNQATVYNNQAIDWLRNMRAQMGWASFANELDIDSLGTSVTYCLNTLPSDVTGFAALTSGTCSVGSTIPGTIYQREVIINFSGTPISRADITVDTYWQSKAHKASTETVLADW